MNRLKILSYKDAQPTFYQLWWQPFIEPYFELIWLDNNTNKYDPKDCVVIIRPYVDNWQQKIIDYRAQGYKVIFDDLWERPVDSTVVDGVMTLRSKNFIRINECLWWRYLNFDTYCPSLQKKTKKFLLLMRRVHAHRDRIYRHFTPILDQSIYSYVGRGRVINNDISESDSNWQRFFNPIWYDSTYFSVVAETSMQWSTFVTEKTYKPLAYYHPFVVFGTPRTLSHVRDQGFETFDHVIDESYDLEPIESNRFNQVRDIVFDLVKQLENNTTLFQDPMTQQKLRHNHETFFNTTLAKQLFCDDILTQILNFAETS